MKFQIEEKFDFIHYVCSLLFGKIYNRINTFGIQKKNNFEFSFQTWKTKKNQKCLKQLSAKTFTKDSPNYKGREVEKHEQVPIDEHLTRPTMVNDVTSKIRVEKRKMLEKRLIENTAKMNKIRKNK